MFLWFSIKSMARITRRKKDTINNKCTINVHQDWANHLWHSLSRNWVKSAVFANEESNGITHESSQEVSGWVCLWKNSILFSIRLRVILTLTRGFSSLSLRLRHQRDSKSRFVNESDTLTDFDWQPHFDIRYEKGVSRMQLFLSINVEQTRVWKWQNRKEVSPEHNR